MPEPQTSSLLFLGSRIESPQDIAGRANEKGAKIEMHGKL
jgi:hypothetical protein